MVVLRIYLGIIKFCSIFLVDILVYVLLGYRFCLKMEVFVMVGLDQLFEMERQQRVSYDVYCKDFGC